MSKTWRHPEKAFVFFRKNDSNKASKCGWRSSHVNRHIKNCYHFDAFGQGFVDILAAEQTPTNKDWFQGTADAVRQVMTRLDEYDYNYVLILSGDQLYQMDLAAFMQQHLEKESELTIATIPVVAEDATGFGIMKVNQENEIEKFWYV